MAVSTDGGETLKRVEDMAIQDGERLQAETGAVLEHIKGENRDPKVFYHKESYGTIYGAIEVEENLLGKSLRVESIVKCCCKEWYRLETNE